MSLSNLGYTGIYANLGRITAKTPVEKNSIESVWTFRVLLDSTWFVLQYTSLATANAVYASIDASEYPYSANEIGTDVSDWPHEIVLRSTETDVQKALARLNSYIENDISAAIAAAAAGIIGGVDVWKDDGVATTYLFEADGITVATPPAWADDGTGKWKDGCYVVRNDNSGVLALAGHGQLYGTTDKGTTFNWIITWPYEGDDITIDTTNFKYVLSSADNNAQLAFETIDKRSHFDNSVALKVMNKIKGKKVIFTFSTDDGLAENVDYAAVFSTYEQRYTIFLVSSYLNGIHPVYSTPCLSTAQIQALFASDFDLGNHSKTHQNLVTLLAGGSIGTVVDEIHGAKTAIETLVNDSNYICKSFAYPSNVRNYDVETYVRKYQIGACTGLDADAPDEVENIGMYHAPRESIATLIGDGLEATIRANIASVVTNSTIWNVWKHYMWHTTTDLSTTQLGWILDEIVNNQSDAVILTATEMFEYLRYINYKTTDDSIERIDFLVDGNSTVLTNGQKSPWKIIPFNCQIYGWAIRASGSDTITADIEYNSSISGSPASICGAGVKPNISAATNGAGTNMTGWTRELTKNGVITVNLSGTPTTATWMVISLFVNKTI